MSQHTQSSRPGDTEVTAAPVSLALPDSRRSAGSRLRRWFLLIVFLAAGLSLGAWKGLPWLSHAFSYESTDDAYVNSHVTFVSPRISGNVVEVLVQDNQRVEPGTILARLDPEPYQLAVAQRRAALDKARLSIDQQVAMLQAAEAELAQARNQVRSQVTGLWGSWYLLQTIQDLVRFEQAALRANEANEKLQIANLTFAQKEYARYGSLAPHGAASREELEQRQAALQVSQEQVAAARESVGQTQALLGITSGAQSPEQMRELPETFDGVRYALSLAQQSVDQLGIPLQLSALHTTAIREQLTRFTVPSLVDEVPAVKVARAHVEQARAALGGATFSPGNPYHHPSVVLAEKELEQAELDLSYTVIKAPIAGYVNRRSVNPGNQVQPGQMLLALRPLQDVWIDANFKENQLDHLRIGQHVDITVDAYPGRVFHGRVAGFSPGTGAALSLLPPENATGNFVKVVQRVPVRIELTDPVTADTPLFVGLSVCPEVDVKSPPTGPDAGQRLLGRPAPSHK